MPDPEPYSHIALPVDLFRALHGYLGQRPAAETARLLLALETSPAINVAPVPLAEVTEDEAPAPASAPPSAIS